MSTRQTMKSKAIYLVAGVLIGISLSIVGQTQNENSVAYSVFYGFYVGTGAGAILSLDVAGKSGSEAYSFAELTMFPDIQDGINELEKAFGKGLSFSDVVIVEKLASDAYDAYLSGAGITCELDID